MNNIIIKDSDPPFNITCGNNVCVYYGNTFDSWGSLTTAERFYIEYTFVKVRALCVVEFASYKSLSSIAHPSLFDFLLLVQVIEIGSFSIETSSL